MSLARLISGNSTHALADKISSGRDKSSFPSQSCRLFSSKFCLKASLKCHCLKDDTTIDKTNEGFSLLASEIPWEKGVVWSTLALYMFYLHIPLGYGGLSIVSYILQQPVLDPQTEVLSLLVVQTLELTGTLLLLRRSAKPQHKLINFFKADNALEERNWLLASVLGFSFLVMLIFVTSLLADKFLGSKALNNPEAKEILQSSDISRTACLVLYCVAAPLLEEIVYRRFLLTSLASTMNWKHAVVISSAIFSAAHFSAENFIQLFIVGCVLGCSYSWSGNLTSSLVIHSLYNALTLLITVSS